MATLSGRQGRVTVGSGVNEVVVAEMGTWKLNIEASEIDTTSFGSEWGKSDVGMLKFSGSMGGFCDPTDTTGQKVIEDAQISGNLIQDIKFYVSWSDTPGETVYYYAPDTATDATAGMRVTSYGVGQDKGGVATAEISLSGSGPVKRFSAVVV